jgi:mono/diheme cytochrome c family protein
VKRLRYVIFCFLFISGCSWTVSPQFRLNTEGRDPRSIAQERIASIAGTLEKLFGTPDKPVVPDGIDLNLDLLKMAAGTIGSDEVDRPWGLYRKHCVSCHGLSGDGAGANAAGLDPYPSDFRNGVFKYTSTTGEAKPLRDDLLRTLRNGNPGTAMPSFGKLPEEQIQSLVEYVEYLSIRGQTELYLFQVAADKNRDSPDFRVSENGTVPFGPSSDMKTVLEQGVKPSAASWAEAVNFVIAPPPQPKADTIEQLSVSIDRGRELFRTPGAQCYICHGWTGKGDGERTDFYDDWNKRKLGDTPERTKELAGLFQLPVQRLRVRDLTGGTFHGGDRPIDIYRRIAVGIKGTPMPASGPAPGRKGALSAEDIWHVVDYVRSLATKGSGFGVQGSGSER